MYCLLLLKHGKIFNQQMERRHWYHLNVLFSPLRLLYKLDGAL